MADKAVKDRQEKRVAGEDGIKARGGDELAYDNSLNEAEKNKYLSAHSAEYKAEDEKAQSWGIGGV